MASRARFRSVWIAVEATFNGASKSSHNPPHSILLSQSRSKPDAPISRCFELFRSHFHSTEIKSRAFRAESFVAVDIHSRSLATKSYEQEEEGESSDEEGESNDDDVEAGRSNGEEVAKVESERAKWHVDKLCPTSLRVRQLKEVDFDDLIEKEKKLKIVLKVKDLLTADTEQFMTLQDLGKCRDYIGLTGNKRIIAFLKRFPGVFIVHEKVEPGKLPWAQLTPEAEAICEEEREIRKGMKVEAVTKLRKLLMMANDKRLHLGKIAHIAKDIGLPEDFRSRLVYKYPKYFRVVPGEDVTNVDMRLLELVKWSDRLAITVEEQKVRDLMEENGLGKTFFLSSVRV